MKTFHTHSSTYSKILTLQNAFPVLLRFHELEICIFSGCFSFLLFPFPLPFLLSSIGYIFVIFIVTSPSLKHIHTTLLPLPSPQTSCFGMESS